MSESGGRTSFSVWGSRGLCRPSRGGGGGGYPGSPEDGADLLRLRGTEEPPWARPVPAGAPSTMGCGLSKLEDLEDSSPGKIYSTLKRPQVETKCDVVHEYVLLDFSLEGRRHVFFREPI